MLDNRFGFTEGLIYELNFCNFYGSLSQIAEGDYYEVRDKAASYLKCAKRRHNVTSLTKGWEWEIEDDGKELVDPSAGVLDIRCVTPCSSEDHWDDLMELLDDEALEQMD